MNADMVNGLFEFVAACFLFLNVLKLHKDKQIRGVSPWPVVFFTAWGFWNIHYYPSLGQFWSMIGGLFVVSVNMIWLFQVAMYAEPEGGFYPDCDRDEIPPPPPEPTRN